MKKLVEFLHSLHPLSDALREYLYDTLQLTDLKKKDRLLRPGQICNHIFFVERGLFRSSYTQQGKEVCVWFMKEGDVICSVVSFFKQVPSTESIYAMEDCRIYSITYEQLYSIFHRYPEFNFIARELTQKYYALSEERLVLLRMNQAADRYKKFRQLYPAFRERIPAKYIASYLGITVETLSRIKNK